MATRLARTVRTSSLSRRATPLVIGAIAGIATIGLGLGAAIATPTVLPSLSTNVRQWTFWTGQPDGAWIASPAPADHTTLVAGSVVGWRFAITAGAGTPQPRMTSQYAGLCPNPTVASGQIGVATVIDFGIPDDAPPTETPPAGPVARCLSLPAGSTAADALAATTSKVRLKGTSLCGIKGYPASECGVVVRPVPVTSESPIPGGLKPTQAPVDASGVPVAVGKVTSSLSPWPYVLTMMGIFAAIILVSWFFLRMRRNSMPPPPGTRRPDSSGPGTTPPSAADSATGGK